ncbi:caspase family protein [Candidatus Halobeggiatoa sp. HSG11]|nr:caspase family protein [Candidatus Halobeggiatoa sp. HSG11]
MKLIAPKNTQVILIGASKFDAADDNLPNLPNVKNNLVELHKSLNEVVGINAKNIHPVLDKDDFDTIIEETIDIFPKASDTIIVYYAGHGIPKNSFYLATKRTTVLKKHCTRAIESNKLVDLVIQETKAKNIIFIIDCCFSARLKEKIDTKSKNVFFIVASSSNKAAKDTSPDNQDCTAFTHELLDVLGKGIKNAGEFLTFQDISNHLEKQLLDKNLPEPQISSHGSPDKLGICKNRAYKKIVTTNKKYKINNDLRHHLPDRRSQEAKLGRAIHNNKNLPLLCLIHSNENQCNDRFIDRLVYHYLPKVVPENDITPYFVHCNFSNSVDLQQEISEQLATSLKINPFAPLSEIVDAIIMEQNPVIFHTDMCTKNWSRCGGIKAIHNFIEFWAKLKFPKEYNHLLLICLYFNYKNIKPTGLFSRFKKQSINDQIRQEFKQLATKNFLDTFGINGLVLPELTNIEKEDVEAWARDHLHTSVLDIVQPKIAYLFKSSDATIPMCDLSRELRKILEEFPPDVFRE